MAVAVVAVAEATTGRVPAQAEPGRMGWLL
jgi:hypothetical protein